MPQRSPALPEESWIRAAVLVPIFERHGRTHVVFIERSEGSAVHKSQMAFPGGVHRHTADETYLETALREAEEEIGLRREDVHVLGALPDVRTMTSHFVIAPFVGRIPQSTRFQPDPREVSDVFVATVEELSAPEAHRDQCCVLHDGTEAIVPTFTVRGRVIWGATERITHGLLEMLSSG